MEVGGCFAVQIGMLFDVREIDVSGDFFAL
jgi:hypothetical protein